MELSPRLRRGGHRSVVGVSWVPGLSALGAPPDPATDGHAFGVENSVSWSIGGFEDSLSETVSNLR